MSPCSSVTPLFALTRTFLPSRTVSAISTTCAARKSACLSLSLSRARISPESPRVASGHLFYLAHGNVGNFQTGQKGELRQRYKNAPNFPPASAASPRYLAAFDSMTLQP